MGEYLKLFQMRTIQVYVVLPNENIFMLELKEKDNCIKSMKNGMP